MTHRPLTTKEINQIANDIVNEENFDDVIWEIEKEHYHERPVDIWTFLYHPQYLGALFNDNGKSKIYPFWMRLMNDLYPSPFYTKFDEVLLSTAIGLGKSTITCGAIACYEQYKLLCLKNPALYYGLMSNSIIVTALFSSTKDLVYGVNWPKLRDSMTISPWFKKRLHLDDVAPKIKSLDLDKNVSIQLGSRTQHAISRDVLIAIVDEGNAGILNDQVKENYNEIYKRRKSRFENGTRVPGLLLACSSPKGEDDFINSRINREKSNPAVLVVDNVAEWQVKDKGYSGKKFWLFIGDDSQDGHCLVDGEDLSQFNEELLLRAPIETRPEFEKDFVGALRDIAGRRSVPATNLFKSRDKVSKAFSGLNLFTKDIIELDVHATLEDIKPFLSYQNMKLFLQRKYSRFIGIDFSLNGDKFGFAMGYAKYPENVEYSDDRYIDKEYVIEAATSFKAKTKEGVPSAAVRQLIRYFRTLGFPIQLITADKPGQVMLQDLLRDQFTVQYLSVDTDRRPYFVLKDQVSLGAITGPNNALLKWEINHVQDTGDKIDHPQTVIGGWCPENAGVTVPGSKDVSDAVTQIVYSAFTNPVQTNIMDVANAINKQMKSSITSQARPMYYNMPRRQMSEYDAMKKALALFNGQK